MLEGIPINLSHDSLRLLPSPKPNPIPLSIAPTALLLQSLMIFIPLPFLEDLLPLPLSLPLPGMLNSQNLILPLLLLLLLLEIDQTQLDPPLLPPCFSLLALGVSLEVLLLQGMFLPSLPLKWLPLMPLFNLKSLPNRYQDAPGVLLVDHLLVILLTGVEVKNI